MLWKVSQENTNFIRKLNRLITILIQLFLASLSFRLRHRLQTHSKSGSQHHPPQLVQAQPQIQIQPKRVDQAVDQAPAQCSANFPVILPQRQQLPAVVRHRDLDPIADEDDSFSIDLDNEAVLREEQACSEVLD